MLVLHHLSWCLARSQRSALWTYILPVLLARVLWDEGVDRDGRVLPLSEEVQGTARRLDDPSAELQAQVCRRENEKMAGAGIRDQG